MILIDKKSVKQYGHKFNLLNYYVHIFLFYDYCTSGTVVFCRKICNIKPGT